MLTTVERTPTGVSPYETSSIEQPPGVRLDADDTAVELRRDRPGAMPLMIMMGENRLNWSTDRSDFTASADGDPSILLSLVHGVPLPPDVTPLAGVRRLRVGTTARIDPSGVSLTRSAVTMPDSARRNLAEAVGQVLRETGEYAIAWSGGLGSAFLLACARDAGVTPPLLQVDLGLTAVRTGPDSVAGAPVTRLALDLDEVWNAEQVTGDEAVPPMPDAVLRQRRLDVAAAAATERGHSLVTGALLEPLTAATLPDLDHGRGGRRLRACEPFHAVGIIPDLRRARSVLEGGGVDGDRQQTPAGTAVAENELPGLTDGGREALASARTGSGALWQDYLASLDPVTARAEAALEEAPVADTGAYPALAPEVLATVATIPTSSHGRIRDGLVESHLPLREAVARHGIGVAERSGDFVLRWAAAQHVDRERERLASELRAESALADLGLIKVDALVRLLTDGADLARQAPLVLRAVWLDRWLRRRR